MPETIVINFDQPQAVAGFIDRLRTLKGAWTFIVKRYRRPRTLKQNAYLWGVVYPKLTEYMRETAGDDEWDNARSHEFMGEKFLAIEVRSKLDGRYLGKVIRTTTKLDTAEMTRYIEDCRMWMRRELGIDTPDPDPNYKSQPAPAGRSETWKPQPNLN
jgi:hypothetical protein